MTSAISPKPAQETNAVLIDCDVHNYTQSIADLVPFLSKRWREFVRVTGFSSPPSADYPGGHEFHARHDSKPPSGKRPGADPAFARQQVLDAWNIRYAILNPLYGISAIPSLEFGNALMQAMNEWNVAVWLDSDPRWRGSMVVNQRDPEAAAAEIRRAARDPRFVQILMLARSHAPYGRKEFIPIYEAACEVGLPVGIHFGGGGTGPITACGWPSYYIEHHTGITQAFEAQVISLVCEGVFERFPELKIALVEGGFGWLPPLMWRLDKNYLGLRYEVPWLKKLPSEYIRTHFRATTQPLEEPPDPRHLLSIIEMIGSDEFLMFSSDYPHWDFDAPGRALPSVLPAALRKRIYSANAEAFYDFERT